MRKLWGNPTYADVAQSVEQLIRNQQVAGSIPAISSNKFVPNFALLVQCVN